VRAASTVGAQHLVYISVVGAERIPVASGDDRAMFGYFAPKRAAERIVEDSGLPWTTLRATQFHDSMLIVARQMAKMPVIPVPAGVRFQPIDGREVATRLVELSRRAVRPRVRHRGATRVRDERASPQLPAGRSPTPPHLAAPVAGQGCRRVPGRC
jgi:uncharacterized protein YbjT (DUF2867 family)